MRSASRRWDRFQISVRSRSSRRQVPTHLSMIEFIRGTRTPVVTISIPSPTITASNAAVNFASRSLIRYLAVAPTSLQIHDQVPRDLGHPGPGRVRGDAQDPHPAGGRAR
jgi:hypothetical protein